MEETIILILVKLMFYHSKIQLKLLKLYLNGDDRTPEMTHLELKSL